jgi:hypothetical protein
MSDSVLPVPSRSAGGRRPSKLVHQYLFRTEHLRREWAPHWIRLTPSGLVTVVITLIGGYIGRFLAREHPAWTRVPIVFWLAALAWFAWRVIQRRNTRFVLTSKGSCSSWEW